MSLEITSYETQEPTWPREGRHLLAQHDDRSVVVYQAYKPSIARFAVEHQHFGGDFSFSRMSWIKPSFLWMMFRCGWATKVDQERVLALHLHRTYFDGVLARVVPSSFVPEVYASPADWQRHVKRSDVRLQWDPDHDPHGRPVARRTIQLGLRGEALAPFAGDAFVRIDDVTDFVVEQREVLRDRGALQTPVERAYPVRDPEARRRLGLDVER